MRSAARGTALASSWPSPSRKPRTKGCCRLVYHVAQNLERDAKDLTREYYDLLKVLEKIEATPPPLAPASHAAKPALSEDGAVSKALRNTSYAAANDIWNVMLRLDSVTATLQMTTEKLGVTTGDLPDVLAGQRDTIAEQREILEQHHDALWRALGVVGGGGDRIPRPRAREAGVR